MRLSALCFLLFVFSTGAVAQTFTATQQKALNNYVEYANHTNEDMERIVKSIIDFYPTLQYSKEKNYLHGVYTCPIQLEDFYLNKAFQESKTLPTSAVLNAKLNALRSASEKIDAQCKALDTYYKLEDFKKDNYAKAEEIIEQVPNLLRDYYDKENILQQAIEDVYLKLNTPAGNSAYIKADKLMREQIKREKEFLGSWTFNLLEKIHTGWPVDKLEKSITDTDQHLLEIENTTLTLKYPASSMWLSFGESLASILDTKRNALDEYNTEAKKNDTHSNEVYLNLINYYNGTLVADYNGFINFAGNDGYKGLMMTTYVPLFEIRRQEKTEQTEVKPFVDIITNPIVVTTQKSSITKPTSNALNNYVDFINEALRQIDYIAQSLRNLNASARYYKDLTSYKGKGGLHYSYENYQVPLSFYQKIIAESKNIPASLSKTLNDEAEVLLNILKEIDQQSATLEKETSEKHYEKDNLTQLFHILERNNELFKIFDLKKEQLYQDVRKVYESYPPSQPASSWYISGKALQQLVDFDHEGLFKAKAYYNGSDVGSISTNKIDETLRTVISNEYSNLKGIEKLGRSNGLCPYTPYEDIPQTSRSLSEALNKLKPASGSGYQHPYHSMVYLYNEIVDDYNKFSELSKDAPLLKNIKQPERFTVDYAEPKKQLLQEPVNATSKDEHAQENVQQKPITDVSLADHHDKKETVLKHDTVYIEKRDTVYISDPEDKVRSMEGYATNNMILLLDVSGSMNAPEKLPLLKESVLDLLTIMRPEDKVSIITYSGKAKVLLPPTSFKEENKIKNVIASLKPSGKTDANAGLKLAYRIADENYIRGGNNRIILATDGEFPVSDETFQMISDFAKQDIFISIFNFGKRGNNSKTLEKISQAGKGNYEYITKENIDTKLLHEAKAKRKK